MTTNQCISLIDEVPSKVQPYVRAMLGASGLSEFDAITSVLFAIATHIDTEQYPILIYLGARGTGKTAAMKQLYPMCRGSKWITGRTSATQRNEAKDTRTAFVDEADIIDNNRDLTELYTLRFSKLGIVKVNVRGRYGGWDEESYNICGATVMAKRTPIGDVALRSRAIIIRTAYRVESYSYTQIGDVSGIASGIASKVKRRLHEIGEVDRVYQTWSSLLSIGQELGMDNWHRKALDIQVTEAESLRGGQGYEPGEAILQAIDILSRDEVSGKRKDKSIKISDVVRVVRDEFALTLKPSQIREEAKAKGFEVGSLHGYNVIKVKKELLDALLPE